jgi:hypothetical protein
VDSSSGLSVHVGNVAHMFEQTVVDGPGVVLDPRVQLIGVDARLLATTQHRMAARALGFVEACRAELRGVLQQHRAGAARVAETAAIHELSLVLRAPEHVVAADVARTARVRDRMPEVWAAWADGVIDQWRVTIIDETAERLTRPGSVARLDREVMRRAGAQTIAQLRRWCNRFVARVEPDQVAARHRDALGRRRLTVTPGEDGISWLELSGPSTDLAAIDASLTRQAWALGAGDPRTVAQRRADIAIDLLLRRGAAGSASRHAEATDSAAPADVATAAAADPTGEDQRAGCDCGSARFGDVGVTIGVTVPIQSLFGYTSAPGELADRSAPLPAHVVRDLAAREGTLFHRLLTDPAGRVLDVTEMGRFPSSRLGTAVDLRDGTCVFPTCTTPAARCDCDHQEPHPQGATTAGNLGPLCRRHHRCKTFTVFDVRQSEPGVFDWSTPAGFKHRRPPDPVPVDTWPPDWDTPDQVSAAAAQFDSDAWADALPPDPLA